MIQQDIRKAMRCALPKNISKLNWEELASQPCAISRKKSMFVTVDHFIPLIWGHGGDVRGNLFPLDRYLNGLKSSRNPFRWINRREIQPYVDRKSWDELIHSLASQSGLTVKEFTQYVYWCERNKRTLEEVKIDPRYSVEIWREEGT
jgi:hypothetical protein